MAYFIQSEIESVIPPQFLLDALDDDGDGVADAGLFDRIADQASGEADAILGQRYATPFEAPVPAIVAHAARLFACAIIYRRRGVSEEANPWAAPAKDMASKLGRIASGSEPLTPDADRAQDSVSVISETAKTYAADGGLLL